MVWSKTSLGALFPILLLVVVTFLIYGDTVRHEFVWDDASLIQRNPRVTRLDNLSALFGVEPFYFKYYRPLVTVSLALDYRVWGLRPSGYHLSNVIFHLGSVLLVYFICLSFMAGWSSFSVALLFGLHPIHTEAVAWISGRSDVLCTFFFLASVLCFVRSVQGKAKTKRIGLYSLSCILFFLSLLAKEMAVTLPLLVLLWWILFSEKNTGKQKKWREILLLLIPFALVLFTYLLWRRTIVRDWLYPDAGFDFLFLGFQTTLWIILKYGQLLILPLRLNAFYDVPAGSKELGFFTLLGLGLVLLVLIGTFLYGKRKGQKVVAFGLGWFLLTLLPVSNLIPTTNIFLAERYLYLPSLGYCLILGWLLGGLLRKEVLYRSFMLRMSLIVTLAGLMLFYAWRTVDRNQVWKDNLALARSILQGDPNSPMGHNLLGVHYAEQGDNKKSKQEYLTALKLKPDMAGSHFNLGILYYQEGEIGQAKEEFKKETEIDLANVEAYYNLGTIYKNSGQADSAAQFLQKAVEIDPTFVFALENLAVVYEAQGLSEKALALWERALDLERDSVWISRISERIKILRTLPQHQSR